VDPGEAFQQLLIGAQVVEHELLLFASFWFILGAIDDLAVDAVWAWLWLTGRRRDGRLSEDEATRPLAGKAAVLIACWQEHDVIGHTIRHALRAWRQRGFILYIGCYANDPATLAAAMEAAGDDDRVRLVINSKPGPTTKADCLNALYAALGQDEQRRRMRYKAIILHDSEDMVHPAELAVIDKGLGHADFVQLPVRPEPQPDSPWVAGHYSEEFTESHAKALVVRDALGAGIPAAGVGCGFARDALARIARDRQELGEGGPFASACLTEDYELGLIVSREGRGARFIRMRDHDGNLVATRSYFPSTMEDAVRQKTRWIHGIALQGWDRLGWNPRPCELWMALRDRRGPLTAVVLAAGYMLVVVVGLLGVARLAGWEGGIATSPALRIMLWICFLAFVWRAIWRFAFMAREYGINEGLRSVMRIPVANVIAIMAGRRALASYVATLRGTAVRWDKTSHAGHPSVATSAGSGRR